MAVAPDGANIIAGGGSSLRPVSRQRGRPGEECKRDGRRGNASARQEAGLAGDKFPRSIPQLPEVRKPSSMGLSGCGSRGCVDDAVYSHHHSDISEPTHGVDLLLEGGYRKDTAPDHTK